MVTSVQDVAAQLGRPITDELEVKQIEAWIAGAEIVIRKRYPNLDQLIADVRIDQKTVDYVEAIAVARYARNPEGATSSSSMIDDYQQSFGTRNAVATIGLLDDEWALLAPSDSGSTGAFTITPTGWRDDARSGSCSGGW